MDAGWERNKENLLFFTTECFPHANKNLTTTNLLGCKLTQITVNLLAIDADCRQIISASFQSENNVAPSYESTAL